MSKEKPVPFTVENMWEVLRQEDTGVLCLVDQQKPYGVPLTYAVSGQQLIFHCALKGRKLDVIRNNPHGSFVVSRHPDRTRPHHPEGKCQYRFESVMCFGTVRVIEDAGERLGFLKQFREYFYQRLSLPVDQDPVTEKAAQACGCFVLNIDHLTGKRN